MEKIGKTVLIIFFGLMLVGIGYILGGRPFYKSKHRIRERNFIGRAYNKIMSAVENIEDMADAPENIEVCEDDMNEYFGAEYEKAETISLDGINNFFLKAEVGEVRIEISDNADEASYKIQRINPKYFDVEKKGDTIKFEDNTPSKFFKNSIFNFKNETPKIYISLPGNIVFNNFEITSGVGEIDVRDINVEKFILAAGVGEVNIYDAKIEKEAEIKAGVGKVNFKDSVVNNMDVKSGVGSFSFSGKALGKTSIEGGIGKADIKIDGSEKDYDFDVSTGLGEVRINGKRSKAFLAGRQKDSGAENTIMVEGGIGSVSISFEY